MVGALLLLAAPASGLAQEAPDPSANAPIRFGPLALKPSLALTNLGFDTNVFNQPDQMAPKRDFTMTLTPQSDAWLRLGRVWVNGTVREDLVYYETYASERAANGAYRGAVLLPLNRLTVNAGASYLNTRDRPGYEIDARSQRVETGFNASIEVRPFPKVFVGVRGDRTKVDFDKAAVFLGNNLRYELNRAQTTSAATLRYTLTPLTTLTFDVAKESDRFDFSSLRDSDSTKITGGVKLDPFALIKGSASFGYRDFRPSSPGVTAYRGAVGAVDLSYVARGSTKVGVEGTRDVQYSYDIDQPYYVLSGVIGSLAQQVSSRADLVGRIGVQRLDYRDRTGVMVSASDRTDYVHMYGGGVGYRLSRTIRVGVDLDRQLRTSRDATRRYSGLRFGTSVTYAY